MANYREPQWLLPNEKNLQYPEAGATQGSGLTADRHSLYSMDFSGTDHINHGSPSELLTTGAFSVSWWMKTTVTADDALILMDDWSAGNRNWQIAHLSSGNVIRFYVFGSSSAFVLANTSINDGNWHHVVCTYEPSTALRIYIDGSLDNSNTTSIPATRNNSAANLRIGKDDFNQYYTGSMDEVAIFSRALSSNEVNDLWNGGAPSNPMLLSGKPVAYYPLGEQARKPGTAEWRFPNEVLQGQVIDFASNTDYINLDSAVNLGVNSTISFWYKTSSNNQGLVPFGGASGPYYYVVQWGSSVNKVYFRVGGTVQEFTGVTEIQDGNWHHYCITRTGANAELFVDGASRDTLTGLPATTDTLIDVIGATSNGTSAINNSSLTQVAFWNSDQSANIDNIYNYGAPQTSYTVTPTAWYKLDKTSTFTGLNPNWHNALSFDGSSNRIDLSSSIDLGTTNTISAWVRNKVSQDRVLLGEDSYGSDFAIFGGYSQFLIKVLNSYIVFTTSTPIIPINSDWAHIVFVRDGDNVSFYINGSLIGSSSTWTNGSPGSATTKFDTIGAKTNGVGTSTNWLGEISNLAVFNQVISAEDIKYLYNGGTPQTNISFEPVSWWKLDNLTTGIQDSGSASNNGTNNGATEVTDSVAVDEWVFENTVQSQTPNWSSALDFDSSTASYINIGTDSSLNFTTAMTFSCWARIDGASGGVYTLAANMQASPYKFNFRYYYAPAATGRYLRLQYANGSGALQNLTVYSDLIDDNWHHLAFTIDGTTNADGISIYIDNVKTSFTATGTNIQSFGSTTLIGGYQTSSTWDFEGPISNAAFWDSSLSTSQINDLYNNGQPEAVISHSPLSYYKLDNTTTGVQDSGSASNNGIIVGTIPEIQTNVWTPRLNGESDTLPSTALVSSDLQFNSAYSNFSMLFDASSTDRIVCGDAPTLSQVTLSAWVKPNNPVAYSSFFGTRNGSTTTFPYLLGTDNTGKFRFIADGLNTILSNDTFSNDTWYNVVGVADGFNLKMYVNGVLQTDTTTYTAPLATPNNKLMIGAQYNTDTQFEWNGNIDECSMWYTGLNQSQITSIYNNGHPSDLTALSPNNWWRLGEDAYYDGINFTIPNKISGSPNAVSDNMPATALVADAPGSYAAGLGSSLALADRLGDAPNSTANSLSFNMTPINRISYPAGYTPTQVDNVYSMAFDGANDHILTTLDITSSTSFSISAWVYANSLGGYNGVASQYRAGNPSGSSSWFLETISSDMAFGIANGAGAPIYATKAFSTSTWHHVVGVWDGSQVEVYIDGVASGSPQSITAMNTATVNMAIGGIWNNGGTLVDNGMWNGKIDEVAIFDYALSARQIKQDIYDGTTSGKTADLNNNSNLTAPIAWYRMGD